jgi:tetratricopeptide (TPR) repeat protein
VAQAEPQLEFSARWLTLSIDTLTGNTIFLRGEASGSAGGYLHKRLGRESSESQHSTPANQAGLSVATPGGLCASELEPNAMWLHAVIACAYARKGNHSQAIAEYEKMGPEGYAVSAENQLIASGLGWVYAIAGRQKDARRVIERFNALSSGASVDPYWVAAIYAGLGERDRAFEFLEKSYRQHSGNLVFLKPDPFWNDARSDPRYTDLLRRMGLPQ